RHHAIGEHDVDRPRNDVDELIAGMARLLHWRKVRWIHEEDAHAPTFARGQDGFVERRALLALLHHGEVILRPHHGYGLVRRLLPERLRHLEVERGGDVEQRRHGRRLLPALDAREIALVETRPGCEGLKRDVLALAHRADAFGDGFDIAELARPGRRGR